jgi:hypothetical protein
MYAVVSRFLDTADVTPHLDVRAPAIDVRDDDEAAVTGAASVDDYLADLFG